MTNSTPATEPGPAIPEQTPARGGAQNASVADATPSLEPPRALAWTGFFAFLMLGWSSILLPSLIREVKADFGQDNIGIGLAYFAYSLAYVVGTLFGGILTERIGRAVVLPGGAGLMAAGLAGCALAPSWPIFAAAYVVLALGGGAIDSGVNGLFIDLFAHRRSGALNRLHLFFSLGAFVAPWTIGLLVGAGLAWRIVFAATAVAVAVVALQLRLQPMPDGRHHAREGGALRGGAGSSLRGGLPLPLIALAIAIGCYIPSEIGVSNWLVAYLDKLPLEVATFALSMFWGGLALGRLVSSLIADRMGAVRFAATWTFAAGAMIVAAVLVPFVPLAIALFAIAGFASGPAYPMIMAIAGSFYPGRSSMVSGLLSAAAVAGAVIYPPLMGAIADTVGLAVGMIGAGLFALVAAGAIALAGTLGRGLVATPPRKPNDGAAT